MAIPLLPSGLSIRRIGSSVFGRGGETPNVQGASQEKQQFVEQTKQFVETQKQNQTVIANMQQQFQNFQNQLNALTKSINNIATLLQQDTLTEQQLLRQQQEQENRYSLRKIRLGRESRLEERIQSAVMAPVESAASKVESIFGRVGSALQTLFFGFLGIQALKAIRAYAEGDEKELGSIKDLVIKNVGFVLGSFLAIKGGFLLIKLALRKLIGGVIGLLFGGISQIFRFAASKIGSILSGALGAVGLGASRRSSATVTPPSTSTGGTRGSATPSAGTPSSSSGKPGTSGTPAASSPKSGGFFSGAKRLFGNLFGGAGRSTAITSTAFDLATGEDPARAVAGGIGAGGAAAVASRLPLPPLLKFPLTIAAGLFGQQKAKGLVSGGEQDGGGMDFSKMFNFGENNNQQNTSNTPPQQPPVAVSTPMQTATGSPSMEQSTNVAVPTKKESTPESPVASKPMNSMMPQPSELKISTESEKLKSPEESSVPFTRKTGITTEGKSTTQPQITPQMNMDTMESMTDSNIFNISKNISFDFITSSKEKMKSPETIAPLQEPTPNVIVTSPQTQQQAPSSNGIPTPTDVPLIVSSNPDNFYVLYSKLNYNVVI